jgi:CcmD family protein
MIKKLFFLTLLLLFSAAGFAQEAAQAPVEMATGLYQSGKIYVVVTVLSVIFLGIVGYLILLDRKISKLEKEISKK